MVRRTSASQSARQKASEIRAMRQQREKKIMEALTAGFEALENRKNADKNLALAISKLLELGETKSSITESFNLSTSEVKHLLATTNPPS